MTTTRNEAEMRKKSNKSKEQDRRENTKTRDKNTQQKRVLVLFHNICIASKIEARKETGLEKGDTAENARILRTKDEREDRKRDN